MSAGTKRGVFARTIRGLAITLGIAAFTFALLNSGLLAPNFDRVEEAVAEQLRDPSSVQFRNMRGSGENYCGEVNGKNGFGAYAGFRGFTYNKGLVTLEPVEPISPGAADLSSYKLEVARFSRLSKRFER